MLIPSLMLSLSFLVTITTPLSSLADTAWVTHTMVIDDEGQATVTAQLTLPAPPTTTYAVLADYPHWPGLFPGKPVIHGIRQPDDRIRVTMHVPASDVPFTLELVTDTVETPPLRLTSALVEGDFERYDWTWDVCQSSDERTVARLWLMIRPSTWIPNWLLRWVLESELTTHFRLLRKQVVSRHRAFSPIPTSAPPKD